MNRENIQKVRDHIAGLPDSRFDITTWFYESGHGHADDLRKEGKTNALALEGSCGTVACIAGHALACLAPNEVIPEQVSVRAAELLGLDHVDALTLFEDFPEREDDELEYIPVTTAEAVRVLDHLLETGEVDWSIIDTVTA